jgi:hypothetical protein
VPPLSHQEFGVLRGAADGAVLNTIQVRGDFMSAIQFADAPTLVARSTDAPSRGTHLREHPRGRGFSVVSRLAREVEAPEYVGRHRREIAELVSQVG